MGRTERTWDLGLYHFWAVFGPQFPQLYTEGCEGYYFMSAWAGTDSLSLSGH